MFCLGRETKKTTYEKAEEALTKYFVSQVSVPFERHLFREMVQHEHEAINQYVAT